MEVFTYKKFITIPLSERDTYLDKFYKGEPHRILAEVINLNNSYAEIKALYLLIHGDIAQPFNFFPDKDLSTIKISGDLKKKLTVGKKIICTLRVRPPDVKGQVFIVRAAEIDYNFEKIENFYQRYGLTYDEKYIYKIFDGESLSAIISDDFKDKLSDVAEKILAERDAKIAAKISKLKKHIAEIDKEIADKNSELQSLQEKISSAQIELEKLQSLKKFYGVDEEETFAEKIAEEFHEEKNFYNYISYWQGHLAQVHGLTYRKEILESIHWGLHTNQLILLTGSPGTGKTSLIRALPKCFGWEDSAIIPVQANWTDKSDLLGYYNPLEKNYMSTPFLDALLKFCRKAESGGTFIICLDEMNLAHVEHYFAEFLSVLQSDRVIRLYSNELRRDIYRELKYNAIIHSADDTEINFDERRFMNMNLEERRYYLQLCRMANMFFKYPATFEIPENIKFFGTLNQDATTLDISPKVLDRAFVIRVEKSDCEIKFDEDNFRQKLEFQYKFFDEMIRDITDKDKFFRNIYSKFPVSQRVMKKIDALLDAAIYLGKISLEDISDVIIASFILPKIRFDADTDVEKIIALKNFCEDYPYSKEILEKYMTSPDGKEIDYWRA